MITFCFLIRFKYLINKCKWFSKNMAKFIAGLRFAMFTESNSPVPNQFILIAIKKKFFSSESWHGTD